MTDNLYIDGWEIDFKKHEFRKNDITLSFNSDKGRELMYRAILLLDVDTMALHGYMLGM